MTGKVQRYVGGALVGAASAVLASNHLGFWTTGFILCGLVFGALMISWSNDDQP